MNIFQKKNIWSSPSLSLMEIQELNQNTLGQTLGIQFLEKGEAHLLACMEVGPKVHQPYGLLHGGATAALAETVGSLGAYMCIDRENQLCVGMEINCNHIRPVREGTIMAKGVPLHLGATTQVWSMEVRDERDRLVAVSRLTVAVRSRKGKPGSRLGTSSQLP